MGTTVYTQNATNTHETSGKTRKPPRMDSARRTHRMYSEWVENTCDGLGEHTLGLGSEGMGYTQELVQSLNGLKKEQRLGGSLRTDSDRIRERERGRERERDSE
jgi:hypothetical protein